jgi:hypothetical protein
VEGQGVNADYEISVTQSGDYFSIGGKNGNDAAGRLDQADRPPQRINYFQWGRVAVKAPGLEPRWGQKCQADRHAENFRPSGHQKPLNRMATWF